jgi:cytochrome c oxidase subunit 4
MSDQNDSNAHDEHRGGIHVVPMHLLVATGVALLVLTWLTVAAVRIDLGDLNIYIALAIAVAKGALVALYFMHLRWDRPFNGLVFVGSLAFVALFIALTMTDSASYQDDLFQGDAAAVQEKIQAEKSRLESGE